MLDLATYNLIHSEYKYLKKHMDVMLLYYRQSPCNLQVSLTFSIPFCTILMEILGLPRADHMKVYKSGGEDRRQGFEAWQQC